MRKKSLVISASIGFFIVGSALLLLYFFLPGNHQSTEFDADRAFKDLEYQVNQGPRIPGSQSHQIVGEWIQSELIKNDWNTEIQETTRNDKPVRNIIARRGSQRPAILIGAHYDSRLIADQDTEPSNQNKPVHGANDGASGVAVLMELSRTLPTSIDNEIWLVFFDTEDQGNIPGWSWIMGSESFANSLTYRPDYVVILDMIGDKDLNIYYEKNSNPDLLKQIWSSASSLGYADYFIPEYKFSILDDHIPFNKLGIPSVDIIDFDYNYWHTTQDTIDKCSPESLKIVGETVYTWITSLK